MKHCVETIRAIVAENRQDRRSILQLGYNLGRLSELTGLGREPFWDRWKEAVAVWDLEILKALAQELPDNLFQERTKADNTPESQASLDCR